MRRRSSALISLSFGFVMMLCATSAHAASITFQLDCKLTNANTCDPLAPFGTIKFEDVANGDVSLTVDLSGGAQGASFKDLMFNYTGAASFITAGNGAADLLTPNGHSHAPYGGLFDVGDLTGNDLFTTTLYGWNTNASYPADSSSGVRNVNLSATDFLALDFLGVTYVSIHVQGSPVVSNAGGSTATLAPAATGATPVPEPGSMTLLGTGLLGAFRAYKRRR